MSPEKSRYLYEGPLVRRMEWTLDSGIAGEDSEEGGFPPAVSHPSRQFGIPGAGQ